MRSPQNIKEKMDQIGVGCEDAVVLYDQTSGLDAMIAAVIMIHSGMKTVKVLTGMWSLDEEWKKI